MLNFKDLGWLSSVVENESEKDGKEGEKRKGLGKINLAEGKEKWI